MSEADLGSGPEVELETVDSRGERLTSFAAAVGAADEASDGLTSLGVAVGDEVGFKEYDHSFFQEDWSWCLSQVVVQHC